MLDHSTVRQWPIHEAYQLLRSSKYLFARFWLIRFFLFWSDFCLTSFLIAAQPFTKLLIQVKAVKRRCMLDRGWTFMWFTTGKSPDEGQYCDLKWRHVPVRGAQCRSLSNGLVELAARQKASIRRTSMVTQFSAILNIHQNAPAAAASALRETGQNF